MRYRKAVLGMLGAVTLVLTACPADENLADPNCQGTVDSARLEGRTLQVSGEFVGGQPIIELSKGGSKQVIPAGEYLRDNATFDLSGLSPGTYSVQWVISCNEGGQQTMDGRKVTSLTIP